jgi:hypothetical protein
VQPLGALGLTKERSDFPFLAAAFPCILRTFARDADGLRTLLRSKSRSSSPPSNCLSSTNSAMCHSQTGAVFEIFSQRHEHGFRNQRNHPRALKSHVRPGYETPATSPLGAVARALCPRRKLAWFCSAQWPAFTPPLTT